MFIWSGVATEKNKEEEMNLTGLLYYLYYVIEYLFVKGLVRSNKEAKLCIE